MPRGKNKFLFLVLLMVLITGMLFFLDLLLGSVKVSVTEVFNVIFKRGIAPGHLTAIIMEFRLPKAITAVSAGIALSISGLQMQTLFRNPLAGPYVLGISAGASLGVAILVLGFSSFLGIAGLHGMEGWSIVFAAWAGAAGILFLILIVSTRVRDIMTILILGIMFGSAISAIVSILQYFSEETMLKVFVVWTMGSLGTVSVSQLKIMVPALALGLLLAIITIKPLNAFLMGENYARSLGVGVKTSRFIIFISTSMLAGTVTAFCGPIGFIGIAVPHVARLLFNTTDHRKLLPATALIGAMVLLIADIVSHLPGKDFILPINSVTALIGIPVVIWIILRNRGIKGSWG
jgi:iron complex transport system permease protein